MLSCTFNQESSSLFYTKTGINPQAPNTYLFPFSLLKIALELNGNVTQDSQERVYIVKRESLNGIATPLVLDQSVGNNGLFTILGNKYWVVKSTQGLDLYNELNGDIESVEVYRQNFFIDNNTTGSVSLPTSYDVHKRIVTSKTRPIKSEFNLATCNFQTRPNLALLDTGINFTSLEIESSLIEDFYRSSNFTDFRDDVGHGTAIASIILGTNLGITSNTKILNVKIFDNSNLVNVFEIYNALEQLKLKYLENTSVPMILNCSWALIDTQFLTAKFEELSNIGIIIIGSAGNYDLDTIHLTPAKISQSITVGNIDNDDVLPGFPDHQHTGYGQGLDIFAPGHNIWTMFNSQYVQKTDTGISTAIVSAAVNDILSLLKYLTLMEIKTLLKGFAVKGFLILDYTKFTFDQNCLLYLMNSSGILDNQGGYFIGGDGSSVSIPFIGVSQAKSYMDLTQDSLTNSLVLKPEMEFLNSSLEIIDEMVKLNFPTVTWNDGEDFRVCEVKIRSSNNKITFESSPIYFAIIKPSVSELMKSDINLENEVKSEIDSVLSTLPIQPVILFSSPNTYSSDLVPIISFACDQRDKF